MLHDSTNSFVFQVILFMNSFTAIDTALLSWFNHHYIPGSIPFLQFISSVTTYVSIAVVIMVFIFSFIRKQSLLRYYSLILAIVLIAVAVVSPVMKSLIYRERPFYTHQHIEKRSEGGESSFPSGHSMEAFALAVTLSLCFRRKSVTITAVTWALLVGYSRIALGVHYPSDVLAGMLIGGFLGWLILYIFKMANPSLRKKA